MGHGCHQDTSVSLCCFLLQSPQEHLCQQLSFGVRGWDRADTLVGRQIYKFLPGALDTLGKESWSHPLSTHRGTEPELKVACSLYVSNVSTCKQFEKVPVCITGRASEDCSVIGRVL